MRIHPIKLEELAEWQEGRLTAERQREVEAHLAAGCPRCQADLAWLARIRQVARSDRTVAPPEELVRRVKASFPASATHPQASSRAPAWGWRPLWGLAAALLLLVAILVPLGQYPALRSREATLALLAGRAETLPAGGTSWQPFQAGQPLREGDSLRLQEGQALLTLFEGTALELGPGAEITLNTLRSSLWGAPYQILIEQHQSYALYDVAALSARSSFEVRSPTVHIAVHGTTFAVLVEDAETRVTVLDGAVQLISAQETVMLAPLEEALVPAGGAVTLLPTLVPTATPSPAADAVPSATRPRKGLPTATRTLRPIPSPRPTGTPQPSGRATELATLQPTPAGEERETRRPTPGALATLRPTALPEVTCTPPPTPEATAPPITPPATTPGATPSAIAETPWPSRTWELVRFGGILQSFPPAQRGAWVIGGQTVLVTAQTRIVGTPEVGRWANVEAVRGPEGNLLALRIGIQEPARTPTPQPTGMPTSQPLETPTPPPPSRTPEIIRFGGIIQHLPAGRLGTWVIGGRAVTVTARTEVRGQPALGRKAGVKAVRGPNDALYAIVIVVEAVEQPLPTATPTPSTGERATPPPPSEEPAPSPTAAPPWSPLPTRTPRRQG